MHWNNLLKVQAAVPRKTLGAFEVLSGPVGKCWHRHPHHIQEHVLVILFKVRSNVALHWTLSRLGHKIDIHSLSLIAGHVYLRHSEP